MNHVLFTPPLLIETCNVLNASSSLRTGTLETVNLNGSPVG